MPIAPSIRTCMHVIWPLVESAIIFRIQTLADRTWLGPSRCPNPLPTQQWWPGPDSGRRRDKINRCDVSELHFKDTRLPECLLSSCVPNSCKSFNSLDIWDHAPRCKSTCLDINRELFRQRCVGYADNLATKDRSESDKGAHRAGQSLCTKTEVPHNDERGTREKWWAFGENSFTMFQRHCWEFCGKKSSRDTPLLIEEN